MRWTSLIAAMSLLALAACGQPSMSPAEEEPAAVEAPSEEPFEETPYPEDQPVEAPVDAEPPPALDDEVATAPPPPEQPATLPDPRASIRAETRDRVVTPVLVELMPTEQRMPRNNGSAAILLADPASAVGAGKNLVLCQALFRTFDQATTREVQVGARPGAEGELELLRPIYWLARTPTPGQAGADRCPQRIEQFDYPRGDRIGRKLGLVGAGPYLVIERHDLFETERVAAVIDLSRTSPDQIANAVRYFRDGFMQAGDIWAPQRFTSARTRSDLIAFLGDDSGDFGFLPRLVRATRQVGCPLTNLLDVCSEPG